MAPARLGLGCCFVSAGTLAAAIVLPALGYAAAVTSEIVRSRLDRGARSNERRLANADHRDAFELENLIEVMETLTRFARYGVQTYLIDHKTAKASGQLFGIYPSGDDKLQEEYRLERAALAKSKRLLLDDKCRAAVDAFVDTQAELALPVGGISIRRAEQLFDQSAVQLNDAMDLLAGRIREIYSRE
jgi:hypothetical protein